MKFKKIEIENFKGIKALSFTPLHKTTVLVGQNGKGKTSFREAVFAGISGNFPENCISNDENYCRVGLHLEDDTEFSRIINNGKPNKVSVNGRSTTAKALTELLETNTGISKDAMNIVSSAEVVQAMTPGNFGNFIMSYIPEEIDFDTIAKYTPNITPEMHNKISEFFPAMPEKFGMEQIQNAYNYFFETRKSNKRELAGKLAKMNSLPSEKPLRDITVIDKEIESILQQEGAQKVSQTAMRMYNSLLAEKQNAEVRLAKLKDKINANKATRPSAKRLDILNKEITDCNEKIKSLILAKQTIIQNIDVFNNTLKNLETPVCPISNKLICTTDKTTIKSELADLVVNNQQSLLAQEKLLVDEQTRLEKLKKELTDYEANARLYNEKVVLSNQYEEQLRNLPQLPSKPPMIESIDFTSQKNILQKEKNKFKEYEMFLKTSSEYNILLEEVNLYDSLCKAFEPKGPIMENVLQHYMSYFADTCNEIAKQISPNFKIKFVSEDGVNYLVKTDGTEYKPYSALSSGEKLLTMFVLLDMLNSLSGLRILMLDDLDKLDTDNFASLLKIIQSKDIQDKYDHIFICAVNHEDIVNELNKYKAEMDFI